MKQTVYHQEIQKMLGVTIDKVSKEDSAIFHPDVGTSGKRKAEVMLPIVPSYRSSGISFEMTMDSRC
jgi:hypothetical protein